METREINSEIKRYLQKRKEIAQLREKLKELQSDEEVLEGTIISIFKEQSIPSKIYYGKEIKLMHKVDVKIFDEAELLREFSKRKDLDYLGEFTKTKVDSIKFKKFAKELLKSKNEVMPGTESTEKDYIKVTDFIGDILSI